MENDKTIETLEKAIQTYGSTAQLLMLFEEMSELQKEICKNFRGSENVEHIAEEIADVEIMIQQVKMIFNIFDEVGIFKDSKVERLEKRLSTDEKSKKDGTSRADKIRKMTDDELAEYLVGIEKNGYAEAMRGETIKWGNIKKWYMMFLKGVEGEDIE